MGGLFILASLFMVGPITNHALEGSSMATHALVNGVLPIAVKSLVQRFFLCVALRFDNTEHLHTFCRVVAVTTLIGEFWAKEAIYSQETALDMFLSAQAQNVCQFTVALFIIQLTLARTKFKRSLSQLASGSVATEQHDERESNHMSSIADSDSRSQDEPAWQSEVIVKVLLVKDARELSEYSAHVGAFYIWCCFPADLPGRAQAVVLMANILTEVVLDAAIKWIIDKCAQNALKSSDISARGIRLPRSFDLMWMLVLGSACIQTVAIPFEKYAGLQL